MEERAWSGLAWLYPSLIASSCVAFYLREKQTSQRPAAYRGLQTKFLHGFLLALLASNLQNLGVEALYQKNGLGKKEMTLILFTGRAAAIAFGTGLGLAADFIGRKKICLSFALFQVFETILKQSTYYYALCLGQICSTVSSCILASVFTAWLMAEHEKHGFHQEWLGDTFCLAYFYGATTSLVSICIGNCLIRSFGLGSFTAVSLIPAVLAAVLVCNNWTENVGDGQRRWPVALRHSYQALRDKNVAVLGLAQASLDIGMSVFELLWIPTIVADGREIEPARIYLLFITSRMTGTAVASYLLSRPSAEAFLPCIFLVAAACLIVPAYDYQEIFILVLGFSVFHFCVGILAPALARLQSISIPSGRRAAVLAFYQIPTQFVLGIFVLQGPGGRQVLDNSTILWTCAVADMAAACGMYVLLSAPNAVKRKLHNAEETP